MSSITTRSGKGSPLTNSEVDANFTNLNTDKLENITSESIKSLSDVYSSMSPSDGQALVFDSTNGWQAENVTTDTSALMPKAGGTFTGNADFNNNIKAQFGGQSGLQVYHTGTVSYVENLTGQLRIQNNANDSSVVIKSDNGSGGVTDYILADGSDGSVHLMHYGSTKLKTINTGVNVTGNITVSGTVDGRDIAAMGTKLDGIETNATADQTKADIDALNINADLLDGQHGSYYTGYTDTAISNLVDSSPSALNTLNELAAALGDDANFSSTITTSIGTKLPKSGGTMTGNINLNTQSLTFSDSSNQYSISSASSSALKIQAGAASGQQIDVLSNTIRLQNQAGTKTGLQSTPEGATTLYHNNAAKIATSSSGVSVTGNIGVSGNVDGRDIAADGTKLDGIAAGANVGIGSLAADSSPQLGGVLDVNGQAISFGDGDYLRFGDNNEHRIHHVHNGSVLRIEATSADKPIEVRGGPSAYSFFSVLDANGTNIIKATMNGASSGVTLHHGGGTKLATSSSGVTVTGTLAATAVTGDGSGLTNLPAQSDNTKMPLSGGTFTGGVTLFTGTVTDRFVLNDNAPLRIGTGHDFTIMHNGTNTIITGNAIFEDDIKIKNGGMLAFTTSSNVNRSIIQFDGTRTTWTNISAHPIRIDGKFEVVTGSSSIASFEDTGVDLYYANSKKFETTSSGVTVTGTLAATAVTGDGSGLTNLPSSFPASGGTFTGDVTFTGANYDTLFFDASANDLIFKGAFLDLTWDANNSYLSGESNVRFRLGDSNNLQLYHGGPYDNYNYIKNTSPLRIKGDNVTFMRTNNHILYDMSPTAHTFKISNANKFVVDANGADLQGDFQFNGGSSDLLWDSSDNKLKFDASTGLSMGTNGEFEIIQFSTQAQIGMSGGQVTFKGGDTFTLNDGQGNRNRIVSTSGTSGTVSLYYGANNKKLETSSSGVTITGTATATAFSGSGANLTNIPFPSYGGTIFSNNSIVFSDNADLKFGSSTNLIISHENVGGVSYNRFFTAQNMHSQFQGDYEFGHTVNGTGGDVTFKGANYNVVWDRSDNALEFADNAKATFGGNALQIYSNGGTSYIKENASGNLIVYASDFYLSETGGTNMFHAAASGGITLKFQGSSKLQTVQAGVNITGTCTASVFNATSDATLKTNIAPIQNPLGILEKITGVSFDWKENKGSAEGVLAQDVEQVLPNAVSTDKKGKKSVSYNNLVGVLIEAVKGQQEQINKLKERLNGLSG